VLPVVTLILLALAVTRLVRLIVDDAITQRFRLWFVNKYGDESMWTYLVHCTWCVSIWVAYPMSLLTWLVPEVMTPLVLLPLSVAQVAPMVLGASDWLSRRAQGED
jgi:membrane protein required for beta-lactamase induction